MCTLDYRTMEEERGRSRACFVPQDAVIKANVAIADKREGKRDER